MDPATTEMNSNEIELSTLIKQAKKLPKKELEPCKDWTKEEFARAKKLYEKIRQKQSSSNISSKLFNESRDCCQLLDDYMKQLEIVLKKPTVPIDSLTELGQLNKTSKVEVGGFLI